MYRTPDGELTWNQFKGLPHIQRLPLQEQVKHYNSYLDNLVSERMQFENWLKNQNKGPNKLRVVEAGFLLQEDLFDLLQEDGSKLTITTVE
jgi:hypothetical protein